MDEKEKKVTSLDVLYLYPHYVAYTNEHDPMTDVPRAASSLKHVKELATGSVVLSGQPLSIIFLTIV